MAAGPTPDWIQRTKRKVLGGVVRLARAARVGYASDGDCVKLYGEKGVVGVVYATLQRASNGEACVFLSGHSVGAGGEIVPFNSLTREGWDALQENTRIRDI
jgi:hypothetical protein